MSDLSALLTSHFTRRGPPADVATTVPYAVLGDSYSEEYRGPDGTDISVTAICPWKRRDDFVRAVLADVTYLEPPDPHGPPGGGVGRLKRFLPEPHPEKPWLYCESAHVVRPIGAPKFPTPGESFRYVWQQHGGDDAAAEVRLTFRALSYFANVTDAQAWADPERELTRYVTRAAQPGAEATNVGGDAFQWASTPNEAAIQVGVLGNEGPAQILPLTNLTYKFHLWPRAAIPHAVLGRTQAFPAGGGEGPYVNFLGRANGWSAGNYGFDTDGLAADLYEPGTLVYLAAEFSDLYYTPSGTEVHDFTLSFQYRPDGWWKVFRRSAGRFLEVTRTDNDPSVVGPATGNAGTHAVTVVMVDGQQRNFPLYHPVTGVGRHMFHYASFYSLCRPGPANLEDIGARV